MAYAARDGFGFVTGRLGAELVGYALGYPLPLQQFDDAPISTRWCSICMIKLDLKNRTAEKVHQTRPGKVQAIPWGAITVSTALD